MGQAALEVGGGVKVLGNKPEITKYFSNAGTPYINPAQVISEINELNRHEGLTHNVDGVEYCWKNGVLVEKIPVITKSSVDLGNVDNTSDLEKPISTAQAAVNETKADKDEVYSGVIRCNTFADMLILATGINYKQFFIENDETNDGEKTRYDWTGTELTWVIMQTI